MLLKLFGLSLVTRPIKSKHFENIPNRVENHSSKYSTYQHAQHVFIYNIVCKITTNLRSSNQELGALNKIFLFFSR